MDCIGIISDTHGLLRQEAVDLLAGANHIIHAGDIGSPAIIPQLQAMAPVTAIRGNVDVAEWAMEFPETARLELFGHSIFIVHDRRALPIRPADEGIHIVVSGHSHRSGVEWNDGVLYINPGSAGPRRFQLPVTVATLKIAGGELLPQVHQIG